MRSNCLVYALREYRRELRAWVLAGRPRRMQPKLQMEPSPAANALVPRFGISVARAPGIYTTRAFVPARKTPLKWWKLWRIIWFSGYVKTIGGADD